MAKKIKLNISGESTGCILYDNQTAELFYNSLPIKIQMHRWGDEYYGDCGIQVKRAEDARADLEVGELAIWPDGNALCIFFGPTPASLDEKPKAISPVNPIGKIEGDISVLKGLPGSVEIEVVKN